MINMHDMGGAIAALTNSILTLQHVVTLDDVLRLRNRVSASFLRLQQLGFETKIIG